MKKAERSQFTKDQKAIAPPLLLENRVLGLVVMGCGSHFTKDQKAIALPLLLENCAFGLVVVGCDRSS